jgi:hypothetical protein
VTDPGAVAPLIGQLGAGHILVTTRRDTGWDRVAVPVRLDILDPGAAADLLTGRTGQDDAGGRAAAAAVAQELGFLPLALDQAAAYITQARITTGAYLDRLRRHPQVMHAATGGSEGQQVIARTWDITLEAITARSPPAIELMLVLACYAPDGIPRAIITARPGHEQLAVDEALGLLASWSMITLTSQVVSMHRLVQAVIRATPPGRGKDPGGGDASPAAIAAGWLRTRSPTTRRAT